jgi:hypothetical protein
MKIHNVRLGKATNSSSTHSVILAPTMKAFCDAEPGKYGWEEFLLTDKADKEQYLASTLWNNMIRWKGPLPEDYAALIINQLLGREVIKINPDGFDSLDYYVDHQSLINFPCDYHDRRQLNLEFFQEFKDYLLNNPDMAISGGNDNSDEKVNYGGTKDTVVNQLAQDNGTGNMVARKDGDHWALYNFYTGAKIRLSFTSNESYAHSTWPELVDVKITNFCPFGCEFCFIPGTFVKVKDGMAKIEDIKVGDVVLAHDDGIVEVPVEQVFEREYDGEIIDIELDDGMVLSVTPEHEIWTQNRGWIVAGDIQEDDEIMKV